MSIDNNPVFRPLHSSAFHSSEFAEPGAMWKGNNSQRLEIESICPGENRFGLDWIDDSPLLPVINDNKIDEELYLRKREPREDNCKRKLCYSPYNNDDGYGLSRRFLRRSRYTNRVFKARGKRFKKDDEMTIDEELVEHLTSQNELADSRDEDTVEEEEEMDEEVNGELMKLLESDLKIN